MTWKSKRQIQSSLDAYIKNHDSNQRKISEWQEYDRKFRLAIVETVKLFGLEQKYIRSGFVNVDLFVDDLLSLRDERKVMKENSERDKRLGLKKS